MHFSEACGAIINRPNPITPMPDQKYYRTVRRLKGYDYSTAGIYFISFNTLNKENNLWLKTAENSQECDKVFPDLLSHQGVFLFDAIEKLEEIHPSMVVLNYVICANHVHLLLLNGGDGDNISDVIKGLKWYVRRSCMIDVWQDGFSDRIVRNEKELERAWLYIEDNKKNVFETHETTDIEKIFQLYR